MSGFDHISTTGTSTYNVDVSNRRMMMLLKRGHTDIICLGRLCIYIYIYVHTQTQTHTYIYIAYIFMLYMSSIAISFDIEIVSGIWTSKLRNAYVYF